MDEMAPVEVRYLLFDFDPEPMIKEPLLVRVHLRSLPPARRIGGNF